MSKIEIFAKEKFGIVLDFGQMNFLRSWSVGSSCCYSKNARDKVRQAKRVYYAYLQDAVKGSDNFRVVDKVRLDEQ